jgi:hypothetical protein
MKKIILLFLFFFSSFSYSQNYEVKKILSPEFGRIPSGKSTISVKDNLIIVTTNKKSVEFNVKLIDDTEFSKVYLCNDRSQNEIRFTFFKTPNYMKYENKDLFTNKVGELQYYF